MTRAPVAVVGGTGTIGSEVVRLLLEAGLPVRMLVRAGSRGSAPSGVQVITADMHQAPQEFLDGVGSLFVVSSDPGGEQRLVRAAAKAGVPRVVKSSAVGFRDQAPAGHAAVEEEIAAGIPSWTVVRPNAFMQTLAAYLPRLLDAEGTFRLPAGWGRTAWVDTRDIAAVCAAVLLRPPTQPGVLTATGPEALDMHQVAAAFTAGLGRPLRYEPTDPEHARTALRRRVGGMGDFLVEHYRAVERGGFDVVSDDVPRLTGRPARSLAQFVADLPDPPPAT